MFKVTFSVVSRETRRKYGGDSLHQRWKGDPVALCDGVNLYALYLTRKEVRWKGSFTLQQNESSGEGERLLGE